MSGAGAGAGAGAGTHNKAGLSVIRFCQGDTLSNSGLGISYSM